LSGLELVRQKVYLLAVMGGNYPSGYECNLMGGGSNPHNHAVASAASSYVAANWPAESKLIWSGFEVGIMVQSGGAGFQKCKVADPNTNPAAAAMISYEHGPNKSRYSWDPLTTLVAVRGAAAASTSECTDCDGRNVINASTGMNQWVSGPKTNQTYLVLHDAKAAGDALDSLLCQPPSLTTRPTAATTTSEREHERQSQSEQKEKQKQKQKQTTEHSIVGPPDWKDPYQLDMAHYSRDCKQNNVTGERECFQRPAAEGAIRVGCVGDSITAVGHTSSTAHHYPDQLQDILDAKHGYGTYSVTNLGVCGSTLQKEAHEPWWNTAAYKTLVSNKWDIIVVMLGTNDAAPTAQGYWPESNHKNCDNATLGTLEACNFAAEYKELLQVIKGVGPDSKTMPKIHIMIPPPLMQNGAYNMNQTIINTIFPQLIPLIAKANPDTVLSVVDVYTGMGGVPAPKWQSVMPPKCVLNSTWAPCKWYCDTQSCNPGQCHPNDVGCTHLAQVVYDGVFA